MRYIAVAFTGGIETTGFQEVDQFGSTVRYTDASGGTLVLPAVYTCVVTDANPPQPSWALPDPAYTPPPPPVPDQITSVQGQLALLQAGLLAQAQAAIAAISDQVQKQEFQIRWGSMYWQRNDPMLNALGAQLGLSQTQIDQLFIAAGALQ